MVMARQVLKGWWGVLPACCGIWLSSYEYESTGRGATFTSHHYAQGLVGVEAVALGGGVEPEGGHRLAGDVLRRADVDRAGPRHLPRFPALHDFVVCTPNDVHAAHAPLGLRIGADVILEKPPALSSRELEALTALQAQSGHVIHPVLQLRYHDGLLRFRNLMEWKDPGRSVRVTVRYVTRFCGPVL